MTGQGSLKTLHDTVFPWAAGAVALLLCLTGAPVPLSAADDTADTAAVIRGPSGYPLPRFVSLDSDRVHMRVGPGIRFPVIWVYHRKGLPLEIFNESEDWRNVRDPDGIEGWIHKAMLTGATRTAVVTGKSPQPMRRRARDDAATVARVEPGVVVRLEECPPQGATCRVEAGGFEGWLSRAALWGVYPDETIE
jgi:SH3-like domain-containing protein